MVRLSLFELLEQRLETTRLKKTKYSPNEVQSYFITTTTSSIAATVTKKRRNMSAKPAKKQEFEDPLDFKIPDGELPSTPSRRSKPFTITTDSYISLCSRVYAAFCGQSAHFAESVSESAFQCYATFLLWKRFAQILSGPEESEVRFWREISHLFCGNNYCVPVPLYTYLRGIGHFADPHGFERQFILPARPIEKLVGGVSYTFGQVTAKSHYFYEAFPAPGISVLRILTDIKYTNDRREENCLWDLPTELRPDEASESDRPTKNLLGWAPAQILTPAQQKLFTSLKIDDSLLKTTDFSSDDRVELLGTEINKLLMGWADPRYRHCGVCEWQPPSVTGSVAQGMTLRKCSTECFVFDRSAMYCEGYLSVDSPYKVSDTLNIGAVISGYRMAKEPVSNRHCWSCYDFNEYTSVPGSWICSRDDVYEYGSVETLNEILYTTGHTSKRIFQNQCIQHTMCRNKEDWNIHM